MPIFVYGNKCFYYKYRDWHEIKRELLGKDGA